MPRNPMAVLRNPAARKSATFFLLKISNTVLATVWSFLLTYSLVRTVGLTDYAFFATVIAFASLVLQADLGISLRLFGRMRQNFLHPEQSSRQELSSAAVAALWSYSAAALVATGIFATLLWGAELGTPEYRHIYLLLFAGSVLPLPWMILRVSVNAFDGYVLSEGIDFVRRLLLVALTGALAFGLPLMVYAVSFVGLWLAGLLALLLVTRRIKLFQGGRVREGFRVLREDARGIAASAALSVSEFLIYIFPYYTIPLAHPEARALVVFDMFYKVTRFGTTAFLTVAETMLPHQTRAYHARDLPALRRWMLIAFALGAVPFLAGSAIVYFAGDRFFGILLGDASIVTQTTRVAICGMLFMMLVQTVSGAVLAGIGWLGALARRASTVLGLLLLFAAIYQFTGWSIEAFIIGYVAIYGLEALAYFILMLSMLSRLRRETRLAAAPAA